MIYMPINVSINTLDSMYTFLKNLSNGSFNEQEIDSILDHPDYQIEFLRYGERVTKERFKNYLLHVLELTKEQIENEDLQVHHSCYEYFFDDMKKFEDEILKIEQIFSSEFIKDQLNIARNGLPDDLKIGDITILFTFGIGMSFGYPYTNELGEHFIHFDVLQLVRDFSIEELKYQLAHEIHHIGVNQLHDKIDLSKIPLEQLFLLFFSGEGLAVKYCNNAKGVLSKFLYRDKEPNLGLDHKSWNYLNDHFNEYFNHFVEDLHNIREGKIINQEELGNIVSSYWMNAHTEEQSEDETGRLKQLPLYSFGNDLWGVIHDQFGKEQVYDLFNNLDEFIPKYNEAIKSIGKSEFLLPER
jgi:hypothetical protein